MVGGTGLTRSLSLNGFPGSGKTYAAAKIVTEMGLKAVVLDFESKFEMTVKTKFPEFADQFEIIPALLRRETSDTDIKRNASGKLSNMSMEISFRHEPDYVKSFDRLKDEIMPEILDRNDYDALIFDGASPIIRNPMGLKYWMYLHPDRGQPLAIDWGTMGSWEYSFIDAGRGWAEENDKLFITTGQMVDDYRDDKKVGVIPALQPKCQHSMDVVLELQRKIYRDHTDYTCVCLDSITGQFTEALTLERHVFEVLSELGLIGFE